ncbi:hypothetical protein D6D28_06956 [Aureobasidium pullulans]|uniref:Uncharacterized protein n=1 Tax=Aureobasidium pullulans TaxID=5580 RepID=A0A4S8SCG7_AURPU|nr:hypothetical protein D6D28_06956 [Aureobasidium pullulans]
MSSRIRKAFTHRRKRKEHMVNVPKSVLDFASRDTKKTIARTQALLASVENSITLGNLGGIDIAEMKVLKLELRRSSLWLKRLKQTATKPEDLGLESFVKKTIEEEASLKAPILTKNIQPRMGNASENSHELLKEKVSVASLVSDNEIMTFLEQKIKERINDAAMDIAKEIHEEREAEIQEQLEKVDEAATAESDDKASESSDEEVVGEWALHYFFTWGNQQTYS